MIASFESPATYLEALKSNPRLAILPIQMVASHRDVSRAAIDRMLKLGQLREIKVRGSRFVDAHSLLEWEQARWSRVEKVRKYLEDRARGGQRHLFYEPVMAHVGLKTGIPADRDMIGWILAKISEATSRESGVLLTVLVHRKTGGRTKPGPGFFSLAKTLRRKWSDDHQLVKAETDKVLRYYSRER